MSYWNQAQTLRTLVPQPPGAVPQPRSGNPCRQRCVACRYKFGESSHASYPQYFAQEASGMWTCGRNRLESARASRIRREAVHQASERNPRRYTSPVDAIIREKHRVSCCNGLRAARLRRYTIMVARLTTVACDANVIAVTYQRVGSSRTYPVDTGRAFAKPV
jgi:hypothetical protein